MSPSQYRVSLNNPILPGLLCYTAAAVALRVPHSFITLLQKQTATAASAHIPKSHFGSEFSI